MNKITCPHCGSNEVRTFRMIYESGTSTAVHNTSAVGVGFSDQGSVGIGVGGAQTTSASITTLAATVAPPPQKRLRNDLVSVGIGVVLFAGAFIQKEYAMIPVGLIFMAIGGYRAYRVHIWNQTVHVQQMEEWESSWKCLSCGQSFKGNLREGRA